MIWQLLCKSFSEAYLVEGYLPKPAAQRWPDEKWGAPITEELLFRQASEVPAWLSVKSNHFLDCFLIALRWSPGLSGASWSGLLSWHTGDHGLRLTSEGLTQGGTRRGGCNESHFLNEDSVIPTWCFNVFGFPKYKISPFLFYLFTGSLAFFS